MLPRTQTGRLAVIALCVCLAGAGCAGLEATPEVFANLSIVIIAELLPLPTCRVWLTAWTHTVTPETIRKGCEAANARSGRPREGSFAASLGGAGAFVIDTVQVEGTVPGSKLPRWTAVLSAAPEIPGAGAVSVTTSVSVTDAEGNPAGTVPAKIQATLYDVDRKGKRKKTARVKARFNKKSGGADARFDSLSGARDHYEVDIVIKGRSVKGGTVNYAAATATQASTATASISGRWIESLKSRAGTTPVTTWAGAVVGSVGTTAASKVPQATIVVHPGQTGPSGGDSARFDVFGLAMQGDAELNPPKQQVGKVQFTLYAVDAKGKRTKLATKTGTAAKENGNALVTIEGVAAPASHYEIDAKAIGGKMQDSNLSFSAIVAPAGLAGRVLMTGRLSGARTAVEEPGGPRTKRARRLQELPELIGG